MNNLTDKTKKILKKVRSGKLAKAKAGRILGVSRKTVYVWLKQYEKAKESKLKQNKEFCRIVSGAVVANFQSGPAKIAQILTKSGKAVSTRTVWRQLKKSELNTWRLRQKFSEGYRKPVQAKNPAVAGQLRLMPVTRKKMIEAVIVSRRSVSEVVKQYNVSRKTFAKWKKRYETVHSGLVNMFSVLADQHPEGANHPRGINEATIKAVLNLAAQAPALSSHKIAARLGVIGNHGVQNVLRRNNLNTYALRLTYSERSEPAVSVTPVTAWADRIKSVFPKFTPSLAPAPPPAVYRIFGWSTLITVIVASGLVSWFNLLAHSTSPSQATGLIFASVALMMGMFFFIYSLKYYLTIAIVLSFSQREGEGGKVIDQGKARGFFSWLLGVIGGQLKSGYGGPVGLKSDLEKVSLNDYPKIAIHIPFYNEKRVVERSIEAALQIKYPNFEVVLLDDSTDETSTIITKIQKEFLGKNETLTVSKGKGWTLTEVEVRQGLMLKHLHRTSRDGYKGAALKLALELTEPEVKFVSVFDADFVPYPDTLELFLKYFKVQNEMKEDYFNSKVAAVQGYQWHVLNKSENWITRGVRSEYAGSYVIERAGAEIYGGLKQVSGSVYMIRRDVLDEVGWGKSITEDFELTLRLYARGYKVVYTPYIQAPAECVSTLKRLIRQRMRWAEGHSQNIKHYFTNLMTNPKLTAAEKMEFSYLSPYYLQAGFFLVGTLAWLISETVFPARLPFWTSLWGWSLVLTNMIALPLMNAVGLFLEEGEEKDYLGLASFVALSYILVPFQAYAAVRGFVEKEEGPWFRTPKTGMITDVFTRGKFYRFIQGILPVRETFSVADVVGQGNPYLALATSNNRFNNFDIRKAKNRKWVGKIAIAAVLIVSLLLNSLAFGVKPVKAAGWYDNNWLYRVKLTIDETKVSADQTDFPVYIDLANMPANFHTHVNQTDARDIRVTSSDGTTELPREVVFYTAASDTGELHFKYTGTLSSTVDTDVYIYYGNASATDYAVTDTYGTQNVWNSNYKATWHFTEASGVHYDSTSNNNDSTTVTVTTQGTANAKLGGADDFDGVNDIINFGSGASLDNLGPLTYSAWIYPETGGEGGYGHFIDKTGNRFYINDADLNDALSFKVYYSPTVLTAVGAANSFSMNAWNLVTVTWDDSATATNIHIYINGAETAWYDTRTNGSTTQPDDNTSNFYVGNRADTARTFDGQIDEVNVSGSVRSSTWISTQYNNQNSNSTFVKTWGAEEDVPELTILLFPLALAAPFIVKYMKRRKEQALAYA